MALTEAQFAELANKPGPASARKARLRLVPDPEPALKPERKRKAKRVINQACKQPNATERRFEIEHLKPMLFTREIASYRFEDIRLRLAKGTHYTPDWVTVDAAGRTAIYEIKGGRPRQREAGIMAVKVAANKYPEYVFWLAVYKAGEWIIQRVLP